MQLTEQGDGIRPLQTVAATAVEEEEEVHPSTNRLRELRLTQIPREWKSGKFKNKLIVINV